ncbi:hypothetical protein IFM61392_09797 [Aspergillus lentulus]|nr:hypothetical protein IFM61392_09797 [Aspergillus lentulus]
MRTFSGSYYANLFRVLEFLRVETRVHRFRYNFHRGGTQYFQYFSNFHKITPRLQNTARVNLYALACYLWYTIAVFLLPPRYARRIRLPSTFLEWYLLPLFSSVATCSHADLRECPAVYIVNYRKGTIGAHHRTIVDMRALQGLLTRNVFQRLQTEVRSVRSESRRVELQFFKSNNKTGLETEVFDFAVLATSAKQAGSLFPDIWPITSKLNERQVFISVTKAKVSEGNIEDFGSESLELKTYSNPSSGPITHSLHRHRSGAEVVVSPCQDDDLAQEPSHGESQAFYLRRPLPTPQSHDLLLSVFGKVPTHERRKWTNGQDRVYLAGGYASAGLPLLEACVRSALEAAVAIGAKLPFAIVRNTPF